MKFIYFIFIGLLTMRSLHCLILSKSRIKECEDRGLHGMGDPQDLTSGKKCEKKLTITMTVRNNQNATERLYATVSRVRDESSNEYGVLYNPFMITVSKTPVTVNYPYSFTGFSVNNAPMEEIKKAEGSWFASDSSKQCYDQWQKEEKEELKPTCGYQYNTEKLKQSDGSFKDIKHRIWDSQGFCCHCTAAEKDANTWEEAKNYKRSGIDCEFFTSKSQASAHCMTMDPLWYTVNTFSESYRDFQIHIRAYDQVEKVVKNKTVIDYVNGGEIVLSPRRKSAVGKYQRILAHYVGDFAPVKSYPVLSERYLLIPKTDAKVSKNHYQIRDGPSKYLILPISLVDLRGGACNKVGVTYSSFKNQAAGGTGFGCQQKQGYCLENQPFHYFLEDQGRVNAGKTPLWFPGRFGKLAGLRKKKYTDEDSFILSYELEEDHISMVTLSISADDITVVYNRASGEIIRAAIKNFESLSMDGKLHVEIRNTGHITADFYVAVPVCSTGIHAIQEKSASVNAQVTKLFVFSLKTSRQAGAAYDCIVQLYDSRRALLSQRNVSFATSTPCVCEQMGCKCECLQSGGVKCVKNEGKSKILPGVFGVKKAGGGFFSILGDAFTGVLGGINDFFGGIFGKFWKYIKYAILAVVAVIAIMLFINCGGIALCKPGTYTECFSNMKEKFQEKQAELREKVAEKKEELKEKMKEKKEELKEKAREKKEKIVEKAKEKKRELKEKVSEKKEQLKEKAAEKKGKLKDKAKEKKDQIKEKAKEKKDQIKEKAKEKKDQIKEKAKEKKNDIKEKVKEKKQKVKDKISGKKSPKK